MPPKKKEEVEVLGSWALGKFSTNLKVGLVGLPNVGKSTLYNSLSKSHHAEAANFPFCTIDPNETRVFVPDERFDWLVQQYKPKSEVEPFLTIVDIAGLVKGAAQGEGLGNAFLSHIKSVDGIIHVMRAFEDTDVTHVDDKVDPCRDIEIITSELRLKDIEFMTGRKEQHNKKKQGAATKSPADKKKWEEELACMEKILGFLEEGKEIRNQMAEWNTKEVEYLNEYALLTAKPVMYAINLTAADYARKKNKFLKPIFDWVKDHGGGPIIPYSGALEGELQELTEAEVKTKCEELKCESALPKMIRTAFEMVHLIYFYTAGADEVRAWVIRKGYKAPQAAGVIHTDFERGFICAEVQSFADLKTHGSEIKVKEAGRYRQEGKNYVVEDGDVIFFKFNVSNPGKKK